MNAKTTLCLFTLAAVLMAGCTDEPPTVGIGLDETYTLPRMKKLALRPALTGESYEWTLTDPDGLERTASREREYVFIAADEGRYSLRFRIIDKDTPYEMNIEINVVHEEVEYSPYIAQVIDYCPAPGQFVNEMPRWEPGDDYDDMVRKAGECISGTNDIMISLGGFGGYVTFAFDHTVVNVPGMADFRIWGNAFYELLNPDEKGGSAEPGIVMVSYDSNCNGKPDDAWYELAGSEHNSLLTTHNYSITYSKAEGDIPWRDSSGATGAVWVNSFHTQPYWPQWVESPTMTFSGTRLADNNRDLSGEGTYYVLYSYPWGYVDNHPNEFVDLNSFDISNAVDAAGNSVTLPGADFIRVYTGLNQYCGWLGETSTEICRACDLHIRLPESTLPQIP